MPAKLFSPLSLRGLDLANRIVVAPMCQYSADDGSMTDWHLMHLGQYAVSGAGLVFVEATGVEAAGRITPGCTGLYSDANEAAMRRVVQFYRDYGNARLGVQLAHAGRKASCETPWRGRAPMAGDDLRSWEVFAPSARAYDDASATPTALDQDGLARIKQAFVDAARRALRVGFDTIEVHCAHGYLLHEFLSPLSNGRKDDYGGGLENRLRFPLEVFDAVRAVCPEDFPVGVRTSATDWIDGGWDVGDTVAFAQALAERGCDYIDVSSGGNSPDQKMITGPGYQISFAAEVRQGSGLTTIAVGEITDPRQADTIIASGQADMVALARGMLYDPRWPWHAAAALGEVAPFPPQYQRAHSSLKGDPVPSDTPTAKN